MKFLRTALNYEQIYSPLLMPLMKALRIRSLSIKNYSQNTSFACLTGLNKFDWFLQYHFLTRSKNVPIFMKLRALFSTLKQIMCHNSNNTQPISTKFQNLFNLYGRHVWNTFSKHLMNICFCVSFW